MHNDASIGLGLYTGVNKKTTLILASGPGFRAAEYGSSRWLVGENRHEALDHLRSTAELRTENG